MADQIKNANVGEVSSPATPEEAKVSALEETAVAAPEETTDAAPEQTPEASEEKEEGASEQEAAPEQNNEEKEAAPKRKEPAFAVPLDSKKSSDKGDNANKPERKMPTFKNEKDKGGENGEAPMRKEPTIKDKERKLPAFADEVSLHRDEDESDDDDFTSDSIAMPFTFGTMASADVSDVAEDFGKKKRKKNKAKKENNPVADAKAAEKATNDKQLSGNMDKIDELSLMGGTMPSVVSFGGEGYVDINTIAYVPKYEEENAIMGKYYKANVAEVEPMLQSPFAESGVSAVDVADVKADAQIKAKAKKYEDKGVEEAAELLAAVAAEKNNKKGYSTGKVEITDAELNEDYIPESIDDNKWVDPGEAEAAALLEAYAEEKKRLKELKKAKRNGNNAVVVETADYADANEENTSVADNNENLAPLTNANVLDNNKKKAKKAKNNEAVANDAPSKKVVLLIPDNQGGQSSMGILAPDDVDFEAYTVTEDQIDAIPLAENVISTKAYDAKREKKARNAELGATAVIYGSSNVKKAQKNAPVANETVYPDAEPYYAPVAEAPAQVKAQKPVKEFSPAVYENAAQRKLDKSESKAEKKAERAALLAVAAAEQRKLKNDKALEKAAKAANTESAAAESIVYGDFEPYYAPAPEAPAQVKAQKPVKEFSPAVYENAEQKKLDKAEAKAEKKAERAALLAVAAAEQRKIKDDKAAEKAAKAANAESAAAESIVYGDFEPYYAPVAEAPAQVKAQKPVKEFSPAVYENAAQRKLDKAEAKAEKKAEREELLAIAAAEKQRAKEEKAAEKAASSAPVAVVETIYPDADYVEGYDPSAFEPVVVVDTSRADRKADKAEYREQYATAAYDKRNDKNSNKAAVAAALVAFYNGNKPVKKVVIKETVPTEKPEIIYSDADYTVGYDPNWAANEEAARVAERNAANEAKRLADANSKAAKVAHREALDQIRYEAHEDKAMLERAERDELLLTYKEEIVREKSQKLAAKAEAKAEKIAAAEAAAAEAEARKVIHPDFTELFDDKTYYAEKQALIDAAAKAEADEAAAKAQARVEQKVQENDTLVSKYDERIGSLALAEEQKAELLALNKQNKLEEKELAARAKAAAEAERIAAAEAAAAEAEARKVIYPDFTELFDEKAYNDEKQAIADAEAKAKADAVAAKEAKAFEKAEKKDAAAMSAYDKYQGEYKLAVEKEKALVVIGNQAIAEEKELKARAKAEAKAEKIAAAEAAAAEAEARKVIHPDFTELFDEKAYNDEKQAIADAEAKAKADAVAAKEAKAFEKATEKELAIEAAYTEKNAKDQLNEEKKTELLVIAKADKAEKKEFAARDKAEAKAAKIAAEEAAAAEAEARKVIHPDFTELFDEKAYNDEKQAIADAEAKAKADAVAAKEAKAFEKATEKELAIEAAYTEKNAKDQLNEEKKTELLVLAKADKAEKKEFAARDKAEAKAAKIAAEEAAAAEAEARKVIHPDFTELFDDKTYYAEKQAVIDAAAKAEADEAAAKAQARVEKQVQENDALVSKYDALIGNVLLAESQKAELLALNKQNKLEEKELAARAKAEAKAEKIAAAEAAAAEAEARKVIHPDFTELFDEKAYNDEKQAIADAEAKAKADAVAAKEVKAFEKATEKELAIEAAYTEKNAKDQLNEEKKTELLVLAKADKAEKKEFAARDKAEAKAEKIAAAEAAAAEAEARKVIHPDFTELFDEKAYNDEKQAIADAEAKAKADAVAAKEAKAFEKATEKELAIEAAYTEKNAKDQLNEEKKTELLVLAKADKAEKKEFAARDKAEAKAAKIAAEEAAAAEAEARKVIHPDFTELFDEKAYNDEKQAIADAEAKAKADAVAAKEAKAFEKATEKELAIEAAYTEKNAKDQLNEEKKTELLVLAKADKAEKKEFAARDKAEAKAEKIAAAEAAAAEAEARKVIHPDFTELFDEKAYNDEKQAIADAEAKAKADAVAAKEAKALAKATEKELAIEKDYTERLAEQELNIEKKLDRIALLKQGKEDDKAVAEFNKNAKLKAKAEKLAAIEKAKADAEVIYPDFTDTSDDIDLSEFEQQAKAEENSESAKLRRTLKKDGKDLRAAKNYEENLENKEMLTYKKEYDLSIARNKKRLKKADEAGKFMLAYGSTYDPEWDGEFNNYGLPEVHPHTEGVKLSTSRRRTDKKEKLAYFDKKKLSALSRSQCDTDNKMIEARVIHDYTALELEVSMAEHEFSGEYKTRTEKRWLRDSKEKLKNLKNKIAAATKYEKLDNERYYSVVATDFETVQLPAKADRDELISMREELMRLLDIRDDINVKLLEIYTGTEDGRRGNIKGRAKATLFGRKKAHARLRRYYKVLMKHRVTRNEKLRIFDKMDEVVALKGDLARLKYILRKEKPTGKLKRECLKEKKRAKRDIRILKKSIERSTIKALRRARRLERRRRAMIISYAILMLLAIATIGMVVAGEHILEATKLLVPESFHQHIDFLIDKWPKK